MLAQDVGERHAAAIEAWGVSDPRPLAGGCVALVCAGRRAGSPVVLKVSPRGHRDEFQLAGEGAALAHWELTGAVPRLLGARDGGFTLLMERLTPGTPLDQTRVGWDDRLQVLGGLAATLHGQRAPADGFISMRDISHDWRRGLAGEAGLLAELERLVAPRDDDVLVHADLHGGNALLHGTGWRAIDPKGVRGDRHADVWVLIEPDAPALHGDPRAAARTAGPGSQLRGGGQHGRARAVAWTRVRALAELAWSRTQAGRVACGHGGRAVRGRPRRLANQ